MDVRAALFAEFEKEIGSFEAVIARGRQKDLSPEVKVHGKKQPVVVRFRGIDDLGEAAARGRWALLFARMLALASGRSDARWGRLALVHVEPASEQEMLGRKVTRPPAVHMTWGWCDAARGVERRDQSGGPRFTVSARCSAELLGSLLPDLLEARVLTVDGEAAPDALPFLLAHDWPNLDCLEWADDLGEEQSDALRARAPLLERITGATERAVHAAAHAASLREREVAVVAAPASPPVAPPSPPTSTRATLCGVPLDEMGDEVQLRANFIELEDVVARLPAQVRRLRVGGGGLHSSEDLKLLVELARRLDRLDIGGNRFPVEVLKGVPANLHVGVQLPPSEHEDHEYGLTLDYYTPYARDDLERDDDYRAEQARRHARELGDDGRAPSLLGSLRRKVERLDAHVRQLLSLVAPDALPLWPACPEGMGVAELRSWAGAVRSFAQTAPLSGLEPLRARLAELGHAPYAFERHARDGHSPGAVLRDVILVDLDNLLPWTAGAVALSGPGELAWALSTGEARRPS